MASCDPVPLPAPCHLIGIDSGTGTRARLTDAQGRPLGTGEAGPSGLALGAKPAWVPVLQAIAQAFDQARLPLAPPGQCALGLGLAGALDPAGGLPLVVTGSVGQRRQPRLPAALRARRVDPTGDASPGALLLLRQRRSAVSGLLA